MKNSEPLQGYTLLENGYVHTTSLTKLEVEEMYERHKRIFPELDWDIAFHSPESSRKNWDKH